MRRASRVGALIAAVFRKDGMAIVAPTQRYGYTTRRAARATPSAAIGSVLASNE